MAYNWLTADFVPSLAVYGLSFVVLFIGSITDLKTREVPDWLNYGLMISGISLNMLFSIVYSDISFLINSIIGLAIFFGIAYIMFYAGQWGGGDSKMIMGIAAMIGINLSSGMNAFLFGFLINALFAGAFYGLLGRMLIIFRNRKKFMKEFNEMLKEPKVIKSKKLLIVLLALVIILSFMPVPSYIKVLALSIALVAITIF